MQCECGRTTIGNRKKCSKCIEYQNQCPNCHGPMTRRATLCRVCTLEQVKITGAWRKNGGRNQNTIKTDNRPENLELWSISQPPGARVSDLLAWAHELIETFE